MAVARAVSEPELDRQIVAAAVEHVRRSCTDGQGAQAGKRRSSYLMELARELVAAPVAQWMQVGGGGVECPLCVCRVIVSVCIRVPDVG